MQVRRRYNAKKKKKEKKALPNKEITFAKAKENKRQ